jgi:hypothetical protein
MTFLGCMAFAAYATNNGRRYEMGEVLPSLCAGHDFALDEAQLRLLATVNAEGA